MLGVFAASSAAVWKYANYEAMCCQENSQSLASLGMMFKRAVLLSFLSWQAEQTIHLCRFLQKTLLLKRVQ